MYSHIDIKSIEVVLIVIMDPYTKKLWKKGGKKCGVKYRKRSVIDDFANKKYEKPLEHGTMQKNSTQIIFHLQNIKKRPFTI